MKKYAIFSAALCLVMAGIMGACSGKSSDGEASSEDSLQTALEGDGDIPMAELSVTKDKGYKKTYNVADIDDSAAEYNTKANKKNCFFVVSKKEYRIYVYEAAKGDTLLVAHYPVCYAKNTGDKTGDGDCCTPESNGSTPFTISEIKDAETWCHDFGWGDIRAYGKYFMRLKLTGSQVPDNRSIGIHGSTGNVESVPGRDSEGCIRLRDADLVRLHDLYAHEGMNVYVKGYKQGKLPYELKAEKALGDKYKTPKPGNPVLQNQGKKSAEPASDGADIKEIKVDETVEGPQGKIK